MNLQLHVTDLDSFSWYNKIDSMTKDDMVAGLLRTDEPNEQMRMGTAFHSIMEDPPDEFSHAEQDGFEFVIGCDCELELPQIREVRAYKDYTVDGITVNLTGKVDGISGNRVADHKLTFRPNVENYLDSYQWRAYLDIFNADMFKYIVYSARAKNGVVTIYDISTMDMFRYPGMQTDLIGGIGKLLMFIKEHAPQMIK